MPDIALFIPIISVAGFWAAVIFWVYMHYTSRHRERMALIESGKDASIFKVPKNKRDRSNALKYGLVGVMAGLGLVFSSFLQFAGVMEEEIASFAMLILFGGLGLIIFYIIASNREQHDGEQSETL
jgi:hypothetical protein